MTLTPQQQRRQARQRKIRQDGEQEIPPKIEEPRKPRIEKGEMTPLEALLHLEGVRNHAAGIREKLALAEKNERAAQDLYLRSIGGFAGCKLLFDGKSIIEVTAGEGFRPVIIRTPLDKVQGFSNTCHMEAGE